MKKKVQVNWFKFILFWLVAIAVIAVVLFLVFGSIHLIKMLLPSPKFNILDIIETKYMVV